MKIFYIGNIRLPTEKAHGIQIMEMCEAFANLGHQVELLVPRRFTHIKMDSFQYYNVKNNFVIKKLPCIDLVRFGRFGFLVEAVTFTISVVFYTLFRNGTFYTRDEIIGVSLKMINKKTIWEAHMGHDNFLIRFLIKAKIPFVVISNGLRKLYERLGVSDNLIYVAPDGVDIGDFDIVEVDDGVRESVGSTANSKDRIVLYTGHLYSWKGADTLAQASEFLNQDTKVVFVGGTSKDLIDFKNKYSANKKMIMAGRKPHEQIPMYLKSADVLVIPNTAKEDISSLYTSPMKLFEYMASKTPIIASDLPSIREILDESMAYFFTPDDPKSLADTIELVLDNYDEAKIKAQASFNKVQEYTWDERARGIIKFILS